MFLTLLKGVGPLKLALRKLWKPSLTAIFLSEAPLPFHFENTLSWIWNFLSSPEFHPSPTQSVTVCSRWDPLLLLFPELALFWFYFYTLFLPIALKSCDVSRAILESLCHRRRNQGGEPFSGSRAGLECRPWLPGWNWCGPGAAAAGRWQQHCALGQPPHTFSAFFTAWGVILSLPSHRPKLGNSLSTPLPLGVIVAILLWAQTQNSTGVSTNPPNGSQPRLWPGGSAALPGLPGCAVIGLGAMTHFLYWAASAICGLSRSNDSNSPKSSCTVTCHLFCIPALHCLRIQRSECLSFHCLQSVDELMEI